MGDYSTWEKGSVRHETPMKEQIYQLRQVGSYAEKDDNAKYGYLISAGGVHHRIIWEDETRVFPDDNITSTTWYLGADKIDVCRLQDETGFLEVAQEIFNASREQTFTEFISLAIDRVIKDMPYSVEGVSQLKQKFDSATVIPLVAFMNGKAGVCVHQSLYLSIIMKGLEQLGHLPELELNLRFHNGEHYRQKEEDPRLHHLALNMRVKESDILYEIDPSYIEDILREDESLNLESILEEVEASAVRDINR